MKKTSDLLKETFGSIPNSFAYREVRFHVYHALQKLEALEKHESNRKKNMVEQEKIDKANKLKSWMPPIYLSPSQAQSTIDMLDQMIAKENKVIESIHAAQNAKKGQVVLPKDNDEDDDISTLHG